MTHRFTTVAASEYAQMLLWYETIQEGLGSEVLEDIEKAIERAMETPGIYKQFGKYQRRVMCSKFQIGIVFKIDGAEMIVTQIMDLRSDPKSWRDY